MVKVWVDGSAITPDAWPRGVGVEDVSAELGATDSVELAATPVRVELSVAEIGSTMGVGINEVIDVANLDALDAINKCKHGYPRVDHK